MHYKSEDIKLASYKLELLLKKDAENESFSYIEYIILYQMSIKNLLPHLCSNCSHCLDLIHYSNIFEEFTSNIDSNIFDFKKLRESLHEWDKIKLYDNAIDLMTTSSKNTNLLNKFEIYKNDGKKKSMYIDMNILINILDANIDVNLFNDYLPTSSPAILNEILLNNKEQNRCDDLINLLKNITNRIMIYSIDNKLEFVKKDLEYLNMDKEGILDSSRIAEELRILNAQRRDLYFDKYNDRNHTKSVNDKGFGSLKIDEFNKILVICASQYTYEELKEINVDDLTHNELNHVIYTLYEVLDVIGFHKDKNKNKIKSGAHDIEHIKYASKCDIFLTADKKLCKRAIEIYKFLGINTKVEWLNEFCRTTTRPKILFNNN